MRHTRSLSLLAVLLLPCLLGAQRYGSSPTSGDTVGYWQQRANYEITARLDETRQVVVATGTLRYTNNSPDVLTEMYVHQYLNAFRPYSKWSDADEREGRTRFQNLEDPAFGFERFTSRPTVDGVPVTVDYPGSPDSTIAKFTLPKPLRPGQSVNVVFAWEARPSTVFRRQGRRGRHYDLAQWYPKVAVYDRGGWQHNALIPAGELYGEFGDFRVSLVLNDDQVVGATGVPVAGDPGWEKAKRSTGPVLLQRTAYGAGGANAIIPIPPSSMRTVVFEAKNVHHFAWTADPEYRYEGGAYVRPTPRPKADFRIWDTVAVHVLYRPADDTTWGRNKVVQRTIDAMKWLEEVYGPYAYPQISAVHRLDGGGTEFPMMMHNGSPAFDLIVHEAGHIFTYGILANNEWRSAWMDEGLTSYQTSWRTGDTPQERAAAALSTDPRWAAPPLTAPEMQRRVRLIEMAEAVGSNSEAFRSFNNYNAMVYDRAEQMYGALRDVLGDFYFRRLWQEYYASWALKHVDRLSLVRSTERVTGTSMGWFFDQWLDKAGEVRYEMKDVTVTQRKPNEWVTSVRLVRIGAYRHPMPVGIRTATGWTFVRGDPMKDDQRISMSTPEKPDLVRLDPLALTDDVRASSQQWPPQTP
ncbi:MAG: M1 family metallopeptidase [Gemmatimonadaceae bacterium]|nr:M1 family metallopeptidase [Gemmatimonadaceae bacterium]